MTNATALEALSKFRQEYDREPDGLWSAPGRVNLIGEHTDYNEGFVLPFAINRRTYAAVALRQDQMICVASSFSADKFQVSLDAIGPNQNYGWAAYPLGVAFAVKLFAAHFGTDSKILGADIYITSDVPVGAGLSSSAAIECAVGLALNELWGCQLTRDQLAEAGQKGENQIVGAPTGIMDQTASLLGRLDQGVFLDCRSLEAKSVNLGFAAAGLELLVIDTQVAHRLVDGGYAERRAACESGASQMGVNSLRDLTEADLPRAKEILDDVTFRRVRHVVTENARVLRTIETLDSQGPRGIGQLMHDSHVSMRDDFEISVDELDTAVETAVRHGAVGARMTGGGFGGAAIALVPVEKISEVSLSIIAEFEALGYKNPNIFTVSAAPGAQREAV